jgi:uncharacterized membrane protein
MRELSWFLFTRGLWLIVLEVPGLTRCLGWQFNFDYHVMILNVLWALGWAMIVLVGAGLSAGVGGRHVRRAVDCYQQSV